MDEVQEPRIQLEEACRWARFLWSGDTARWLPLRRLRIDPDNWNEPEWIKEEPGGKAG